MNGSRHANLRHDHVFGQDKRRPAESRTISVIALTTITMIVEIVAGWRFGSMALLADGLHMASHAVALAITAAAYVYARKQAGNAGFSFGTGKVNALAGFSGAILLAGFALLMAGESFHRFLVPVSIAFNQAIFIALVGLAVNGLSVLILGIHDHEAPHDHRTGQAHGQHHDHNLRSAYLHVLADALTSLLAIVALLAGKYWGWNWMDPAMGVAGAILVARWSWGLIRQTSAVLLDRQDSELARAIREVLEADDQTHVTDIHVWSIGPGLHAVDLVLTTTAPLTANDYRALLPKAGNVVHATIEVHAATA
jgi:cation diffusion facilitator family transporter